MAVSPSQRPDNGGDVAGVKETEGYSGTGAGSDPTNEPGQYPPVSSQAAEVGQGGGFDYELDLFGTRLPTGTGAPGSGGPQGGPPGTEDPTNEPGQLYEGLSGEGPDDIANSGAPGMATDPQNATNAGVAISYTRPGAYLSGTYKSDTVNDNIDGPKSATEANDIGYASGGPKFPGMFEPEAGNSAYQPPRGGASGHVLRGGRDVRP